MLFLILNKAIEMTTSRKSTRPSQKALPNLRNRHRHIGHKIRNLWRSRRRPLKTNRVLSRWTKKNQNSNHLMEQKRRILEPYPKSRFRLNWLLRLKHNGLRILPRSNSSKFTRRCCSNRLINKINRSKNLWRRRCEIQQNSNSNSKSSKRSNNTILSSPICARSRISIYHSR
jgi:hypothetical protein